MILTRNDAECLALGSQILGFGGGGDIHEGRTMYQAAFRIAEEKGRQIELISVDELAKRNPDGGTVVTISGVGSPASEEAYTPPEYYPRLMELLEAQLKDKIVGFIACEIGASSSFEPMIPAAMLNVPVIDAPCDGRAHPLGLMGALGLEKKGFRVIQAGVGGKKGEDGKAGKYVEISVNASVQAAAGLIRNAAAQAGGAVSVARNPVDISWVAANAALGAYEQTLRVGNLWKQMVDQQADPKLASRLLADLLKGSVVIDGTLRNYRCSTENALDNGSFEIYDEATGESVSITFFNEYMTMETADGIRKFTFPDGMALIGEDLIPYSSAMIDGKEGQHFFVIATGHENLKIPTGLRYREGYRTVEDILKKDMIKYLDNGTFFLD
ncbi:MAG: DUF917 family protein [Anaerovoracaceae bacterium]